MREDGGDGEAAGAFDVHEEGAGRGHEHLKRYGSQRSEIMIEGCDAKDKVWEENVSSTQRRRRKRLSGRDRQPSQTSAVVNQDHVRAAGGFEKTRKP